MQHQLLCPQESTKLIQNILLVFYGFYSEIYAVIYLWKTFVTQPAASDISACVGLSTQSKCFV